ncbi:MAG: HAD-IIB family hydrolase, partial [Candidatus Bathyarchaeia archaeon]
RRCAMKGLDLAKISAVVADYDRTLSDAELQPSPEALEALAQLKRRRGWRIIIASGRPVGFFLRHERVLTLADAIVAENGAVIHIPRDGGTVILGSEDLSRLKEALSKLGVPFEAFDAILSIDRGAEGIVKRAIAETGVEVEVEYNVDTLMILPKGVDKLRGVRMALGLLGAEGGFIAFGDGENDAELIGDADFGVAVANAAEEAKAKADYVTNRPYGEGVAEFIRDFLLRD